MWFCTAFKKRVSGGFPISPLFGGSSDSFRCQFQASALLAGTLKAEMKVAPLMGLWPDTVLTDGGGVFDSTFCWGGGFSKMEG